MVNTMSNLSLAEIKPCFYRWQRYSDFCPRSHWRWRTGVTNLSSIWWYHFPVLASVMLLDCTHVLSRSYNQVAISRSVGFTPFIANKLTHKIILLWEYQRDIFFKIRSLKPKVCSTFPRFPGFKTQWHLHSHVSCSIKYPAPGFVPAQPSNSIELLLRRKERSFKPSSLAFLKCWSWLKSDSAHWTHTHTQTISMCKQVCLQRHWFP